MAKPSSRDASPATNKAASDETDTEFDPTELEGDGALPEPVQLPTNGKKVALNVAYYAPRQCSKWPVFGYPIGVRRFKEGQKDKDGNDDSYEGIVFRLLGPCVGVNKDENGKKYLQALKKDDDVCVPFNYQTEPLAAIANMPVLIPYSIKFTQEKQIGPKQSMWEVDVEAYPELAKKRSDVGGKLEGFYVDAAKRLGASLEVEPKALTGSVEKK